MSEKNTHANARNTPAVRNGFEMGGYTLARNTDPATSHAAAAHVHNFAASHQQLILSVLKQHPGGLTIHELERLCDLDYHAIGRRMKEMEKAGQVHVRRVGAEYQVLTRTSPSGRQARVWGVYQ